MYESPITQFVRQMQSQMESELMLKVSQEVGYSVNKDELVKALKYDRKQYEQGYSDGLDADKWISIKERLPEKGQSVLIYYPKWDGDEIQVAKLEPDGIMFDICGEFNIGIGCITHWQPLPAMPREAIIIPEEL